MNVEGKWWVLYEDEPLDTERSRVDWSTTRFELYRANWPVPEGETEEEEWARDDWENEHFGMSVTYGTALRAGPGVHEAHEHNGPELAQVRQ